MMNDKAFLRYALEQSFIRPCNTAAESMILHYELSSSRNYVFTDKKHLNLIPYFLPFSQAKKYAKTVAGDIGHNQQIFAEYERYKHDLTENIIIPENMPELKKAHQVLDLQQINRQSAQKKKIAAAVIPATFTYKMKEIHLQYQMIFQKVQNELQKNPDAVNLSLIRDFAKQYSDNMRYFSLLHPFYRLNKKRMNYYINEAAQILKSSHPLDEDYCISHCFHDVKLFGKTVSQRCTNMLSEYLAQLKQMSHQPKLLNLVQILLANRNKYLKEAEKYATDKKITDIERITTLRHGIQALFEKYAFLCYLDGVRFAFENKFLNECPEPRHPPLPTVSPQEELKVVSLIVAESYKIDATSGKIKKLYLEALQNYENEFNQLNNLILSA